MKDRRKICIVTGTRAEYGLLYWLMKEIENDEELELQIIVTGMHLSHEFGLTYKQIEEDGFKINSKVEMLLSSDTPVSIAKSVGLGVIGFADALENLKPDILVVLGDRFEILSVVQSAMIAGIPIAHIHGGEITEGAIDDSIRHAITKMSQLHFVAAEPYRQRVIQLGENPARVFNFGTPGLDNIKRLPLLDREQFQDSIDFSLGKINFLVTYHPVTLNKDSSKAAEELLYAMDKYPEAKIIITKANADAGGREINRIIDRYAFNQPDRVRAYETLGQVRYLSAIKHCDIVIGNSSSGIIEAPFFKKPTVNIGDRQKGRLRAKSVLDCRENGEEIFETIQKALSPEFYDSLNEIISPYGEGDTSSNIKETLKNTDIQSILIKKFHDIEGLK